MCVINQNLSDKNFVTVNFQKQSVKMDCFYFTELKGKGKCDNILSYRTNVRYRKEAEMTLEQLGMEYLKQADVLKDLIANYSAQRGETCGIALYELNSKITTLREMERDIRILGKNLTEYYSGKSCKKQYHQHGYN